MFELLVCFLLPVAPRNMLLNDDGRVLLCDFGLSRRMQRGKDYYRKKTDVDMPLPWMAPESFVGVGEKFNAKTDVRMHF